MTCTSCCYASTSTAQHVSSTFFRSQALHTARHVLGCPSQYSAQAPALRLAKAVNMKGRPHLIRMPTPDVRRAPVFGFQIASASAPSKWDLHQLQNHYICPVTAHRPDGSCRNEVISLRNALICMCRPSPPIARLPEEVIQELRNDHKFNSACATPQAQCTDAGYV